MFADILGPRLLIRVHVCVCVGVHASRSARLDPRALAPVEMLRCALPTESRFFFVFFSQGWLHSV